MISVILGTFNRLAKLKRSLESIAKENQLLQNSVEVVVADGGSTDGTLEYLRSKPFGLDLKYIAEGSLHGVTRCYNRGFRLASRPLVTWTSDDCRYESGSLPALVQRINAESPRTLVGCYTNNSDGKGWVEFSAFQCCTIGGARKTLFEDVDFWSEDYVTYASDIEFSSKINRSGGKVVFEPKARVFHEMDSKDSLHGINNAENIASKRFADIYHEKNARRYIDTSKMYPDVFISANDLNEYLSLLEKARTEVCWGNFYSSSDFGQLNLLTSMNVRLVPSLNKAEYDVIVSSAGIHFIREGKK